MIQLREEGVNVEILEQLFKAIDKISEGDLLYYIDRFLNRKQDRKIAIKELHNKMNKLNYITNNFYNFFNSKYYYPSLTESNHNEAEYFTVEEIAKSYKITVKTIANWEKAGLRILRPSPRILVISKMDLFEFFEMKKSTA